MKNFSAIHFCLVGAFAAAMAVQAATLDGIAAKVNDDVITVDEVAVVMRHSNALANGADFKVAYSNAVEAVIARRLILRAAAERKLNMQEWIVDNRVREIVRDRFGGDMNKLNASLAQSRVALTDWRNDIRDEMVVQAMRYQIIDKNVVATPSAMQKEYDNHPERYQAKDGTSVNVILLRPPENDKTPSTEARAREILDRLAKGEKFAKLAREFSADSHAKDGGLWKDVNPEETFRSEVASAISKLNIGQVSPLINLDGWGFIVQKVNETKAAKRTFSEAYDDIAANVKREAGEVKYREWIQRLREESFVKIYPPPSAE